MVFNNSRLSNVAVGLLELEPLQRVQNAAAQLVFDLCHRDRVSPYLMQLHWLPVRSRVQFKLCTLMHAIHNKRSPSYLSDTVQTVATATTRCGLRSSATTDYVMPHTLSKFGERAFMYVVSPHLQSVEDIWKRFYSLKFLTLPRTLNNCNVCCSFM